MSDAPELESRLEWGIPTVDDPTPGRDGYVGPEFAGAFHAPDFQRVWKYRGVVRSAMWRGNPRTAGVLKNRAKFDAHTDPEDMRRLLRECYTRGVERPSSYGDIFQQRVYVPRCRAFARKIFPVTVGAYNQVIDPDRRGNPTTKAPLWKYDIRSAYLSALAQGLPHPDTFVPVKRFTLRTGPGLYLCPSPCLSTLPHPWNKPGIYPASEDDLMALPLPWREIRRGVAFLPGTLDVLPMIREIRSWDCWKQIGRQYWGLWASGGGLTVEYYDRAGGFTKESDVKEFRTNPIFANLITGRLRLRLWREVDRGNVLRVYTDSVVTTQQRETGEEVGDWQEIEHYPRGGRITQAGVIAA